MLYHIYIITHRVRVFIELYKHMESRSLRPREKRGEERGASRQLTLLSIPCMSTCHRPLRCIMGYSFNIHVQTFLKINFTIFLV